MSVAKIARHFQGMGKVPVTIHDVLEQVRLMLPDEEIEVFGVNTDINELRGTHVRFKIPPPNGTALVSTKCSMVIYSKKLEPAWQRLVCCKELIHVLDADPVRTTSKEEVLHLVEKISSKMPINPNSPNSLIAFVDKIAEWQAVSILFPYGLWEQVYPEFKEGKVTVKQIAEWLEIPESYVHVTMTDLWKHMSDTFLSFT